VLQVPNAAAQLMVDPLLGRSILCFKGRIRGDVLRHVFSPNDFLRKQIKAKREKNREEVKHEITQESKRQVKENSLSNRAFL
jgi:hypothetical protein